MDYLPYWANSYIQGLSNPEGVAIYNGFVYVCNPEISTVSKICINNPEDPETLKEFLSNQVYVTYNNPRCIAIHGDFAYVTSFGSSVISKIFLERPKGE